MNQPAPHPHPRPATWAVAVALTLVYLCWGTTYLAIQEGVRHFPPALFGGVRLGCAGLILLAFSAWRGHRLWLPMRDLAWAALGGMLMFVGGNGLITVGQLTVASGEASVLVATTPLWMALLQLAQPAGDRLNWRGWAGILGGMAGVAVLLGPELREPHKFLTDLGPLLVIASAFSWALGSVVLRHRRSSGSHLLTAGYQLTFGGLGLTLIGLAAGEAGVLTPDKFTPAAVYAFFHLLVFGSLIGYVAFNWLLTHTSPTLAGTYAYVNPLVAILAGWLVAGEELSLGILFGMALILPSVALVRAGLVHRPAAAPASGEKFTACRTVVTKMPARAGCES